MDIITLGRSNPPLKNFNMGKFLDWLKADNAMTEVMRSRVKEASEAKERYELLQNAIRAESALNDYVQSHCLDQRDELVKQLNKLLYEEAEKTGVSLYTLCSSVSPEFSYDYEIEKPYEGKVKIKFVKTIKLESIK